MAEIRCKQCGETWNIEMIKCKVSTPYAASFQFKIAHDIIIDREDCPACKYINHTNNNK